MANKYTTINQAEISLGKYKGFLKLSAVLQSSPISLGQIICCVCKNQTMYLVAKLAMYFSYRTRVMQVQV